MMLDKEMVSDESLLEQIREGKMNAFDELYRRYQGRLYRYICFHIKNRNDAEELFQEVLIKVLHESSLVLQEGHFAGWLFKTARNTCLEHLRSCSRRNSLRQTFASETVVQTTSGKSEELLPSQLIGKQLDSMVTALSESHQQVLLLRIIAELNYRDIAIIQGVPEGTVKSRLHFAISAIRKMLLAKESCHEV